MKDILTSWPKSVNRQSLQANAADSGRPGFVGKTVNGKHSGLIAVNVGQPCFEPQKNSPSEWEMCFGFHAAVWDNEQPNGTDEAKKGNWRGTVFYPQGAHKFFRCGGAWAAREGVHYRISGPDAGNINNSLFEECFFHSPGDGDRTLMIFASGGVITGTRIRRTHLYIPEGQPDSHCIRYIASDVPSDIELSGNYFFNGSGPAATIYASKITGGGNIFVGGRDGVLRIESANLTRDPLQWTKNLYFDPHNLGFHVVGWGKGDRHLTWEQWRAETGDNGAYFNMWPTDESFAYPSPVYPGRALVMDWNHSMGGQFVLPINKCGLTSGQKFIVLDVQNILGSPVASGIYTGQPGLVVQLPDTGSPIIQRLGSFPTQYNGHTSRRHNQFMVVPVA